MSGIFIQLYLDEDVSVLVAKLLRSRGFDIVTTGEAGCLGSSDSSQLAYAAQHGMALVTHNRVDFERLAGEYFSTHARHSGIIIAVRRRESELAGRLFEILNQVTVDEMEDQVLYI